MATVEREHDAGVGREARVSSLADLRWLFETSPDLIFIADRHGTFHLIEFRHAYHADRRKKDPEPWGFFTSRATLGDLAAGLCH